MASNLSKSVVIITGTFIENNCWDEWDSYFGKGKHKCIAPDWTHTDADAAELRNRPSTDPIALIHLMMLNNKIIRYANATYFK